jgi:hypothetical protein
MTVVLHYSVTKYNRKTNKIIRTRLILCYNTCLSKLLKVVTLYLRTSLPLNASFYYLIFFQKNILISGTNNSIFTNVNIMRHLRYHSLRDFVSFPMVRHFPLSTFRHSKTYVEVVNLLIHQPS